MVHFQSMFVGSIFSITSFLIVHQQLSYREQLSKKWKLRIFLEGQINEALDSFKKQSNYTSSQQQRILPTATDLTKSWNQGIGYIKDAVSRKDDE